MIPFFKTSYKAAASKCIISWICFGSFTLKQVWPDLNLFETIATTNKNVKQKKLTDIFVIYCQIPGLN